MAVYIQKVDVTASGLVQVAGQLSSNNIEVSLNAHQYIQPPLDKIWDFSISETITGSIGNDVLTPFSVSTKFDAAALARGVRIHTPNGNTVTHLTVEKVEAFTERSENHPRLVSVNFDNEYGELIFDIEYSGGCIEHNYTLEWDGTTLESQPPQYRLQLVDLSPYDPCEAWITRQIRFDITGPTSMLQSPCTLLISTPDTSEEIAVHIGIHQVVELTEGQELKPIDERLSLAISSIEDSRCPIGVHCVWPGRVDVDLKGTLDGEEFICRLPASLQDQYHLVLNSVTPYPSLIPDNSEEAKVVTVTIK